VFSAEDRGKGEIKLHWNGDTNTPLPFSPEDQPHTLSFMTPFFRLGECTPELRIDQSLKLCTEEYMETNRRKLYLTVAY
jgi:hypothetical protein